MDHADLTEKQKQERNAFEKALKDAGKPIPYMTSSAAPAKTPSKSPGGTDICYFWKKGQCRFGAKCNRSHNEKASRR